MKFEFSRLILENTQISNFMKILPEGVELFHADRKNRHDEANSRFRQFCESAETRRANYCTFMTMQTVFGREPTTSFQLPCAIFLGTLLEKDRNGQNEGRKENNFLYFKVHIF
jgi:4-alpha-glucanotransferase